MSTLIRIGIALSIVLAILNLVGVIQIPWLTVFVPLLLPIVVYTGIWIMAFAVLAAIILVGWFSEDFIPEVWREKVKRWLEGLKEKLPRR
ncbi:MAG: hypothetical protein ABIH46_07030 [Chloroflexota bacterium]